MIKRAFFSQNASILLVTLIFMVTLLGLAAVFINSVSNNMRTAGSQNDHAQALYLAEAGVNMAIWYLKNTAPDSTTDHSWRTSAYPASGSSYTSCTAGSCLPKTESLNNGTYTVWVETSGSNIKITSKGTFNNLSRTVQIYAIGLYSSMPSLSGLVGWWKFDEGTSTTAADSSGSGNTGTLTNNPTWTAGHIGTGALVFNGSNSYVRVSDSNSLDLTTAFTMCVWMKSALLGQTNRYLFSKLNDAATDNAYSVLYGYAANKVQFYTASQSYGYPGSNSNISITDTNWHFVAYTYDGSSYISYLDGSVVSTVALTANLTASTGALIIGGFDTGAVGNHFLNGSLDDLRIYNRALSASEISQLYQAHTELSILSNSWKEL